MWQEALEVHIRDKPANNSSLASPVSLTTSMHLKQTGKQRKSFHLTDVFNKCFYETCLSCQEKILHKTLFITYSVKHFKTFLWCFSEGHSRDWRRKDSPLGSYLAAGTPNSQTQTGHPSCAAGRWVFTYAHEHPCGWVDFCTCHVNISLSLTFYVCFFCSGLEVELPGPKQDHRPAVSWSSTAASSTKPTRERQRRISCWYVGLLFDSLYTHDWGFIRVLGQLIGSVWRHKCLLCIKLGLCKVRIQAILFIDWLNLKGLLEVC